MDQLEYWESERVKVTVPGPDGQPMRVEMTCAACPTQYDIFLADGRYVYFRYRHQHWSLELFPDKDAFVLSLPLASQVGQYGDHPLDGMMDHSEVMGLLEVYLPALLQEGVVDVAPYRRGLRG
jgi:hypothetical protein